MTTVTIQETLAHCNGVSLAKTTTGAYLVGIGYRVGQDVVLHPFTDLLLTDDYSAALQFFQDKSSKGT